LSAVPEPDPEQPPRRIVLDPAAFKEGAPLRELASGHFAAV
jgi:hypothetical protein